MVWGGGCSAKCYFYFPFLLLGCHTLCSIRRLTQPPLFSTSVISTFTVNFLIVLGNNFKNSSIPNALYTMTSLTSVNFEYVCVCVCVCVYICVCVCVCVCARV
jgi:hypothetical protein